MRSISLANDRIINRVTNTLEQCSDHLEVEILSIVLFGSRARGDYTSQSDYEFLILVSKDTPLKKYVLFNEELKLELVKEKYLNVKVVTYTPEIFEEILYEEKIVGTYLYMICRDNIVLYDKHGTFLYIREKLSRNKLKNEEVFLQQCIEFSRLFGSEKWERKWDKTLMQFKYNNNRRKKVY